MSGGMQPAVVARLGERIRAARQELDLSVGALAERSDVSRRMLTQIELGQANPSVSLVDRVAAGLGTTFAALMGVGSDAPPDGVEVWSSAQGSWAVLLDALDAPGTSVETWKWWITGGDSYTGGEDPFPSVMVHVVEGALEIATADGPLRVDAGGSGRIPPGAPYTYRAADEHGTAFLAVALMPRAGDAPA